MSTISILITLLHLSNGNQFSQQELPNLDVDNLLSGRLEVARCLSKCSRFQDDKIEEESCIGMCTGQELCAYSWLCTGRGCTQGCSTQIQDKVEVAKFWQDENTVFWRIHGEQGDERVTSILLGVDSKEMWSIISEAGLYNQYTLDTYTQNRFHHLAVVVVSSAGVQDTKIVAFSKHVSTTTMRQEPVPVTTIPPKSAPTNSKLVQELVLLEPSFSLGEILLFILAVITTLVTLATLILFFFIIKDNRKQKIKEVKTVKLSPIINDYSKIPSSIV